MAALRITISIVALVFSVSSIHVQAAETVSVRAEKGLLARLAHQPPEVALKLSANHTLKLIRTTRALSGHTYARYRQLYRGVPVWGHRIIVARDGQGQPRSVYGQTVRGLAGLQTQPTISASDAGAAMRSLVQNRRQSIDELRFENESRELVIYTEEGSARLAYEVSFFADVPDGGHPTRPFFVVDAHTGAILKEWEGLAHADATGPGGNEKTEMYVYGTDFDPLPVSASGTTCTMDVANVATVDLNHGTSGSTPFSFTCPENTYKTINGAYSPLNDAHFFGGVVFDMYHQWLGTAPLYFQLTMRVHYSNNYENAFWDGSSMTFGDGQNTFYPLVSLDVSAHEVSHGYTEQNSGLIYAGESGGINEAFSDIAGEAAEYFLHGTNDFMVGADIYKASNAALRYMDDPTRDGRSIGHVNDMYFGIDVHYSSGIYNKAFYQLVNDSDNRWDVKSAFILFAEANRRCWMPSSTFESAYDCLYDTAVDLHDEAAIDVQEAFNSVGVGIPAAPVCDGNVQGTLTNGVPTNDFSGTNGSWKCWTLEVPPDATNLVVELKNRAKGRNPGGDADLYIKNGDPVVKPRVNPPTGDFVCGSYTPNSDEQCTVENPEAGLWYLAVYAWSEYPRVELTGTYTSGSTPPEPEPTGDITASAEVKRKFVNITWSGAAGSTVDVYRNSWRIATTNNDGNLKDSAGSEGDMYQVCEAGSTDACSEPVAAQ